MSVYDGWGNKGWYWLSNWLGTVWSAKSAGWRKEKSSWGSVTLLLTGVTLQSLLASEAQEHVAAKAPFPPTTTDQHCAQSTFPFWPPSSGPGYTYHILGVPRTITAVYMRALPSMSSSMVRKKMSRMKKGGLKCCVFQVSENS